MMLLMMMPLPRLPSPPAASGHQRAVAMALAACGRLHALASLAVSLAVELALLMMLLPDLPSR